MNGEKKTARVDLWLPPQMKLVLELLAERDRRKLSEYVRVILEDHIANCAVQNEGDQERESGQ